MTDSSQEFSGHVTFHDVTHLMAPSAERDHDETMKWRLRLRLVTGSWKLSTARQLPRGGVKAALAVALQLLSCECPLSLPAFRTKEKSLRGEN